MRPEGRQPLSVDLPLVLARELRPLEERRVDLALDAVLHFAVDHDFGAVSRQKLEMRCDCSDLLFDRAAGESARIPARQARQSVLAQLRPQRRRLLRELVPKLETLVADLLSLRKRGFERRVTPERRQFIVHPTDRVDADANVEAACHRYTR